jgi:hypothetical protein
VMTAAYRTYQQTMSCCKSRMTELSPSPSQRPLWSSDWWSGPLAKVEFDFVVSK